MLDRTLQREDDGSALFLLDIAQELLHVMEEPIRTQVHLREHSGACALLPAGQAAHCPVRVLLGVVHPQDEKATWYCDRVTAGFPCKQRGARFKRNPMEDEDGALKICNQMRDRMYARLLRWQDTASDERDKLIPMDYE